MRSEATVVAARTDKGLVRANNEDSHYVDPQGRLFLVADGLGGHAGGEEASQTVVKVVGGAADRFASWSDPSQELPQLLQEADDEVRQRAVGPLTGMGSTVVALFLAGKRYWTVHAGDSRAYLLRAGQLKLLTRDHTPETEAGLGLAAPFRSGMITRAIGIGQQTTFDVGSGACEPEDRFLLCSDGLTDAVPPDRIAVLLERVDDVETAASRLVEAALSAGGPDNVTVIVIQVG
jgi:serine/threonine protein phosphatase PrpC